MRKMVSYLVYLLLTIFLILPSTSLAKGKLAVMDLKAKHGVKESLAEGLSVVVRDAIQGFGDYEVLSKEDVEVIAERTAIRQALGCDDTKCLINIGRSLGTKFMVAGAISKFGETYNISLRLIDTMGKDPGVKQRVNRSCECREDELISSVTLVAGLLMGKDEAVQPSQPRKTEGKSEKTFTNSIGMRFVLIPTGTFMMGSPPDEQDRWGKEIQHKVTLTKPFYLQTTEVTQRQWVKVMGDNPSHHVKCGMNCPVEMVLWQDSQNFISRLNHLEGTDKYRLPTEAEWEYSCRSGSSTRFYFGASERDLRKYAWFKSNSSNRPHEVGQKKPNSWGLYDTHGNVWEWCQDWYGRYPQGHITDPEGFPSGTKRVMRGGSYQETARNVRSALRIGMPDTEPAANVGFRVARDP
jgi:formylglycine-generating enzyme required for sulfatase activity